MPNYSAHVEYRTATSLKTFDWSGEAEDISDADKRAKAACRRSRRVKRFDSTRVVLLANQKDQSDERSLVDEVIAVMMEASEVISDALTTHIYEDEQDIPKDCGYCGCIERLDEGARRLVVDGGKAGLREALVTMREASSLIDDMIATHVYQEDEEIPEDCGYKGCVQRLDEVIAKMAGRGN